MSDLVQFKDVTNIAPVTPAKVTKPKVSRYPKSPEHQAAQRKNLAKGTIVWRMEGLIASLRQVENLCEEYMATYPKEYLHSHAIVTGMCAKRLEELRAQLRERLGIKPKEENPE
jgi:hypothetical protein